MFDLDSAVRKIKDFPKPGILFYDITSVFENNSAFNYVCDRLIETYKDIKIDRVIGIEARGFLLAPIIAKVKNIPIVLARKKGKLPGETYSMSYSLEYGTAEIEIHKSDLKTNENILIVDDLIATGGTIDAVCKIVEQTGNNVEGIFSIIDLPFLNYKEKLGKYNITSLLSYDSE